MKTQLAIVAALLTLTSTPAFAVDAKMLGGMSCVPADGDWTSVQPSAGRMWVGIDKSLECPVLKDSTSALVSNSAMVHLIDNNTTADATCVLRSKYMTTTSGTIGNWSASASTTGDSSFMRTLQLSGTLGANTESASTAVYYYLDCDIPAGGRLVSYYWEEN